MYVEQFACLTGRLDLTAFEKSWENLIRHHSILRSGYYYNAFKVAVQCVYKAVRMPIEVADYRGMSEGVQREAIRLYKEADRLRRFDFKTAPLMRIGLIRLGEDKYQMIWTFHHIIIDGWSLPILMDEFLQTYEALATGESIAPKEEDRYEDYIRYIDHREREDDERYWRKHLSGMEGPTLLPFIKAFTKRNKGVGVYKASLLKVNGNLTEKVGKYAQRYRVTVNTVMQGVWALLLHRYTGQSDIVYGVTVSGRPEGLAGVENRVGVYINTLPFYSALDDEQEIVQWLQSLQQEQSDNREHQYSALSDIQRWIGVSGDLFDSVLVFENYPISKVITSRQWALQVEGIELHERGNYPVGLVISMGEEINIRFNYNSSFLGDAYVKVIVEHFEQVLNSIAERGQYTPVKDIRLMTPAERQLLLEGFNDTGVSNPGRTVVDLFMEQAVRTPAAAAVVCDGKTLGYRQLEERSNQLAHYLRAQGVGAETLVPICIERSLEMLVGILGILKAGGAYVPIDPDYPKDRIGYMLDDTGATLVVSSSGCIALLPEDVRCIALDSHRSLIDSQPVGPVDSRPVAGQLAYVIYTSGSMGRPKGVLLEHGGLENLALAQAGFLALKPGDKTMQFASIGFDASVWEIFATLITGGALVIPIKEDILLTERLIEMINREKIFVATLPPSYLEVLSDQELHIGTIISAGEALTYELASRIRAKGIRLINAYGPTESTVCATMTDDPVQQTGSVTIGKPISNIQLYITDERTALVPIGNPGELLIAGAGLARGYLNQPELTAEKFIADPFSTVAGGRLYRSGDLCRWLADGNIEYLGRIDDQVKVRGYRVELGEIASVLEQHPLVRQAVVLARAEDTGNKRLVAYIVVRGELDREAILDHLKSRVPDYMVPSQLVGLGALPLTANGKIDRKALALLETGGTDGNRYVAPGNAIEETLAGIWQELLEVQRVGVEDDFFELGGHSLLALRLISAVRKQLDLELSIGDVFEYPTISTLARQLGMRTDKALMPVINSRPRPDHIPLSISQERLWFIDQLEGSVQYHVPAVLRLKGILNREALEFALREIVNRHEVLRTVIVQDEGKAYQRILDKDGWHLICTNGEAYDDDPIGLREYIGQRIAEPFDLSKDHLLRAELIGVGDQEHVLVVTMHHIASDGWSNTILVREFVELYDAYNGGREARLSALNIQYADYAIWQRSYLQGEVLDKKLAYWKQKLEGVSTLNLPTDFLGPSFKAQEGQRVDTGSIKKRASSCSGCPSSRTPPCS